MVYNHFIRANKLIDARRSTALPVVVSPGELFRDHSLGLERLARFDDVEVGNALQFLEGGEIFFQSRWSESHVQRVLHVRMEWTES